jgi:hypothetical protein
MSMAAFLRQQLEEKDKQISELHILLGSLQQKLALSPAESNPSPKKPWWRFWRR